MKSLLARTLTERLELALTLHGIVTVTHALHPNYDDLNPHNIHTMIVKEYMIRAHEVRLAINALRITASYTECAHGTARDKFCATCMMEM